MDNVTNQPPPLETYNLLQTDRALCEALVREKAGWAVDELTTLGKTLGAPETIQLGFAANGNPPVLRAFDRYGHPIDEVEFHPAWHALLSLAVGAGLHCSPWATPRTGAHVARAAGTFMLAQIESGVYCPIAMTYGAVPALRHAPDAASQWLPRIFSREYDPRFRPAAEKTGVLLGMAMTENQGGSDLRTNTTQAEFRGSDGPRRVFKLTGQKWFMSAPMSDAFLVLAQATGGLSCFLVPRWTRDGARNGIHLVRLKDKLGNRSNASSEVEFAGAEGDLIGEEGRGIPTIIEMSNYARLDCAIGSAGLMRQAVAQAIHHASYRVAFQKKLVDHSLMTNVLADLVLESEAATVLIMRLARAYDEGDDAALIWRRVMTPAAKFWICKRAPALAAEAMEVLGGSGYVEECVMPRLYREAPVNSIWEGAGNIMCLDVLRALERMPDAPELLLSEMNDAARADTRVAALVTRLRRKLSGQDWKEESQARAIVRDLVLGMQAALLLAHAPAPLADAFCSSRLGEEPAGTFGLLPSSTGCRAIVERAAPRQS
jgi:putative acyl-CoA dehydrogenase